MYEVRMSWSPRAVTLLTLVSVLATGRVTSQGIVSQFGVASGVTVPTGAYHAGSLGGFNAGWQGMALVGFKLPRSPVGLRLDVTYGTNRPNDQFKSIYQPSLGRPPAQTPTLGGANLYLRSPFPLSPR